MGDKDNNIIDHSMGAIKRKRPFKEKMVFVALIISVLVHITMLVDWVYEEKRIEVTTINPIEMREQHLEDLDILMKHDPNFAKEQGQVILEYLNRECDAAYNLIDILEEREKALEERIIELSRKLAVSQ